VNFYPFFKQDFLYKGQKIWKLNASKKIYLLASIVKISSFNQKINYQEV